MTVSPVRRSVTMFTRPEMPSSSASSGSAAANRSSAGTASNNPMPITCGASRGDIITSGAIGP